MADITNQNCIYIYRIAMILPVATLSAKRKQRNDKCSKLT